jgi:N-acetyl-gamma-glutamyl-phosphate reductase
MYRAGIAGATGYTGIELIKIIHRHPELELAWATSESNAGQLYSKVYPVPWDYELITLSQALERADEVDVVFLCLPHTASIGPVRAFRDTGLRVVDLSADFRLRDTDAYPRWYGIEHTAPELLSEFVYGLCEVYREDLRGAQLISSPGCYPTSANLGLYPLARAGWLSDKVIIDSKSGISGAGRKAKLLYNFVEANENLTPYSVGYRHRHIAEIEQVLDSADPNGAKHRYYFTPQLLPVSRGILSTMYVSVPDGVTENDVRAAYADTYAGEPFIHLLPPDELATLGHVTNTNRCAISITPANPDEPDGPDYIIVCTLDNLLKGASGQMIQGFNIAAGIDETAGLI